MNENDQSMMMDQSMKLKKKYFLQSMGKEWNDLPDDVRNGNARKRFNEERYDEEDHLPIELE